MLALTVFFIPFGSSGGHRPPFRTQVTKRPAEAGPFKMFRKLGVGGVRRVRALHRVWQARG